MSFKPWGSRSNCLLNKSSQNPWSSAVTKQFRMWAKTSSLQSKEIMTTTAWRQLFEDGTAPKNEGKYKESGELPNQQETNKGLASIVRTSKTNRNASSFFHAIALSGSRKWNPCLEWRLFRLWLSYTLYRPKICWIYVWHIKLKSD